jgi:hypothetical protein
MRLLGGVVTSGHNRGGRAGGRPSHSDLKTLLSKRVDCHKWLVECGPAEGLSDVPFVVGLDDAIHHAAAEEDERSEDRLAREGRALVEGFTKDRDAAHNRARRADKQLELLIANRIGALSRACACMTAADPASTGDAVEMVCRCAPRCRRARARRL